jgi:hypothetical protein
MIATLAVAAAVLAGGGAALAQGGDNGSQRCERRLERIAERRGITVAALEAQIRVRLRARIDEAVRAGRITEARAAELRARVNEGNLCRVVKAGHRRGHAGRAAARRMLRAAVGFLGVSSAELRAELRSGKSLQAVAEAKGKSVAGLKAAMLAPIAERLDKAVKDGRITDSRREALLERLAKLADRLLERTLAPA